MGLIVGSSCQGLCQYQDGKREILYFPSDSHNLGAGIKMGEVKVDWNTSIYKVYGLCLVKAQSVHVIVLENNYIA